MRYILVLILLLFSSYSIAAIDSHYTSAVAARAACESSASRDCINNVNSLNYAYVTCTRTITSGFNTGAQFTQNHNTNTCPPDPNNAFYVLDAYYRFFHDASCPLDYIDDGNGNCIAPVVCTGRIPNTSSVPSGSCDFDTAVECMRAGHSFNECVGDVGSGLTGLPPLDPALITPNLPAPSCVGDGSGNEVCFVDNPPDKQCGMVNGSTVCLDRNDNKCRTASLMTGGTKTVCPSGTPPPSNTGETHTQETQTISTNGTASELASTITYNTTGDTTVSGAGNGSTVPAEGATDAEKAENEKASGSVSGGGTCDAAPSCKGDVFQCAIIQQQFLTRCPGSPFVVPSLGDTGQKLVDIKTEFDAEWQIIKTEVEAKFNATLSSGGSIPTRITSIAGVDMDFSLQRFLPYLQIIAGLIVAAAWVMAAGIVLNGRG